MRLSRLVDLRFVSRLFRPKVALVFFAVVLVNAMCAQSQGVPTPPSKLTIAPVFSDHAVLQCEKPLAIWGKATPGSAVEVSLAGERASTYANADGQWRVTLSALPPGGPHELIVRSGDSELRRSDLLLGEVWLCGVSRT